MNNHDESTAGDRSPAPPRARARGGADSVNAPGTGHPEPAPVNSSTLDRSTALLRQVDERAPVVDGDLGRRLATTLEGIARRPGTGSVPYRLYRLADTALAAPLRVDKAPQ